MFNVYGAYKLLKRAICCQVIPGTLFWKAAAIFARVSPAFTSYVHQKYDRLRAQCKLRKGLQQSHHQRKYPRPGLLCGVCSTEIVDCLSAAPTRHSTEKGAFCTLMPSPACDDTVQAQCYDNEFSVVLDVPGAKPDMEVYTKCRMEFCEAKLMGPQPCNMVKANVILQVFVKVTELTKMTVGDNVQRHHFYHFYVY